MPRKSFVPGAALVAAAALAVGLASCTDGSGPDGSGADAKDGGAASSNPAAEPGRYQTLPEACGLPSRSAIRGMLPGDGQPLSSAEADKVYGGQADITYDTDRRVGCRWTRESTAGTRHIGLDIQRVVSYDGAVSDDDKAQGIYEDKELAAKIPSGAGSPPPAASSPSAPKDEDSSPKGKDKGTGPVPNGASDPKGKAPSGSPSPTSDPSTEPSGSTAPRVLDGLADAAFLNDKLVTADSGVHRDVTVVFRTSNVIVTLTYDQWSTDKTMLPESQELQDKARSLAGDLADSLSE
ncbi:hypothetical protein HXP44_24210 [Streptomyces sioyaensis]|uniref:DUF3558 domain-containing protein n=1 Tax=Streptomyces sioyaensis TaxID=67364 RepID=A0A4Q1QY50_9ACTN|nr:hypothetical protein [Streptomyces sioyaensis]MBM4795076.1 hypothetical protein [Streptomyces sioyaensis]RXS64118.1 hypothetical protein EST54_23480 [Streptomyces sioyaensis]